MTLSVPDGWLHAPAKSRIAENNKNGFLINSIDEAVEKILIISKNKTLLKEMGDNSFNKFEANYTLDKMYNSYMELYSKLLDI